MLTRGLWEWGADNDEDKEFSRRHVAETEAMVADSRGLVFLRMGDYDKSIADYDSSLKIDAKNARSLYGRGIDKLRKQRTSEGDADIAQATAVWPEVAEDFKRHGIGP